MSPAELLSALRDLGEPPEGSAMVDPNSADSCRAARGFLRALRSCGLGEDDIACEVLSLIALWCDERVLQPEECDAVCNAVVALHETQKHSRDLLGLDAGTTDGDLHPSARDRLPAIHVSFPNPAIREWMREVSALSVLKDEGEGPAMDAANLSDGARGRAIHFHTRAASVLQFAGTSAQADAATAASETAEEMAVQDQGGRSYPLLALEVAIETLRRAGVTGTVHLAPGQIEHVSCGHRLEWSAWHAQDALPVEVSNGVHVPCRQCPGCGSHISAAQLREV